MKKKILCFLLSFCMTFSYFSGSITAIAEDGMNTEVSTQESNKGISEPSESIPESEDNGEDLPSVDDTIPTDEVLENESTAIDTEQESTEIVNETEPEVIETDTTEEAPSEVVEKEIIWLKVVLNNNAVTKYYGQPDPDFNLIDSEGMPENYHLCMYSAEKNDWEEVTEFNEDLRDIVRNNSIKINLLDDGNIKVTYENSYKTADNEKEGYYIEEYDKEEYGYIYKFRSVNDEGMKFTVKNYEAKDIYATVNGKSAKDTVTVGNSFEIVAPENFKICDNNNENSEFGDKITVNVEKSGQGSQIYYLKNADKDSAECGAISEAKTLNYNSVQNLPSIESAEIKVKEEGGILNFLSFGAYSNKRVELTIKTGETIKDNSLSIALNEGEVSEDLKWDDESKKYTIKYIFDLKENAVRNLKLTATISSEYAGTQTQELTFKGRDKDGQEVNPDNLTLDNIKPTAKCTFDKWECTLNVSDTGSGIQTVTYNWKGKDSAPPLHPEDLIKNDYEAKIPIIDDSKILHIKVVDNAGNEAEFDFEDEDNMGDRLSPVIDSIKVFKADGITEIKSTDEQYYSDSVSKIVIRAHDPKDENSSASESITVMVGKDKCSRNVDKDGTYYYQYEIPNGFTSGELVITVYDEKPDESHAISESVNIIIDNTKPVIEFISPSIGVVKRESENDTVWWYGIVKDDNGKEINDSRYLRVIASGSNLESVDVVLDDNEPENVKVDNNKWIRNYSISQFEEGKVYTISVKAKNKAGLESENSYKLRVDKKIYSSGQINITEEEGKNLTVKDGGNIKEQLWFDKYEEKDGKEVERDISFNITNIDTSDIVYVDVTLNDRHIKTEKDGQMVNDPLVDRIDEHGTLALNSHEFYDASIGGEVNGDGKHCYTIKATIVDKAGNTFSYQPKTYYKDYYKPRITKVKLKKSLTDSGAQFLKFFTFGIVSTNKIDMTITAYDRDKDHMSDLYDSGIAKVYVIIDGDDNNPIEAKGNTSNSIEYTYTLPEDFDYTNFEKRWIEGDISFKVIDEFGKNHEYKGGEIPFMGENEKEQDVERGRYIVDSLKPQIIIDKEPKYLSDHCDNSNKKWLNAASFEDKIQDHILIFRALDEESGFRSVNINLKHYKSDKEYDEFIIENMETAVEKNDEKRRGYVYTGEINTDEYVSKYGDGRYVITITVRDYAGNFKVETIEYNIDNTIPEIKSVWFTLDDEKIDASEFVEETDYGYYFQKQVRVNVEVNDVINGSVTSGLDRLSYRLVDSDGKEKSGSVKINETDDGYIASFIVPEDYKGQIYLKAADNVKNESEEVTPKSVVIDTPAIHNSEEHIIITGFDTAKQTDNEGHPLYDTSVNPTVKIVDEISGIKNFTYSINSEQVVQEERIDLNDTGYSVGQNLGNGWIITAMDRNLVTEVQKDYSFAYDNNNVQLLFSMTDNAENSSSKQSQIFSLDFTSPEINVSFDNPAGNNEYYREQRTATITVIERNFDPSRIIADITNSIGSIPSLSFSNNSDTEHVASLVFGEGDYTFSISGSDLCGHVASVSYSGGNEQNFHVDMTDMTITDNFDQFTNNLANSYNQEKEMTFTVTEHNFMPSLMDIHVYRTGAGQQLSAGNREDCTSEFISDLMWSGSGDVHSISLKFTEDYVYQVTIGGADSAGRTVDMKTSPIFEIDSTVPILVSPTNLKSISYTSKEETSAEPIVFKDSNIVGINYTVNSYQVKVDDKGVGNAMNIHQYTGEVKGDKFIFSEQLFKNDDGTYEQLFKNDGIYEVTCKAYDTVGNKSSESTHTFIVLRDSDFLVYIPNSDEKNKTGYYKFNEKSMRYDAFEDIDIVAYVKKNENLFIQIGDESMKLDDNAYVEGNKNKIGKNENEEINLKSNSTGKDMVEIEINGIDKYEYTFKSSYISANYNDDNIETNFPLNIALGVGDNKKVINLGRICIDNVKPVGEYQSSLQNLGFFDGFYGKDSQELTIEGVSSDIDPEQCEIQVNDDKIFTKANGGLKFDEKNNTISFVIEKGYNDIRPILKDKAGNVNPLPIKKNVYVGSVFSRWWIILMLGIIIVLFIPFLIIKKILRQRKTSVLY